MAKQAKAVLQVETLEAVAGRGYFHSPEILACHEAGIKSEGRFGKQDVILFARGGRLAMSSWGAIAISLYEKKDGKMLRRYWTQSVRILRSPVEVIHKSWPIAWAPMA